MKNKVREYSILRVILILLVVMTHSQYLKITTSLGGVNYVYNKNLIFNPINNIRPWIGKIVMPVFLMWSIFYVTYKKNSSILCK